LLAMGGLGCMFALEWLKAAMIVRSAGMSACLDGDDTALISALEANTTSVPRDVPPATSRRHLEQIASRGKHAPKGNLCVFCPSMLCLHFFAATTPFDAVPPPLRGDDTVRTT
jgi:hypothetical protein